MGKHNNKNGKYDRNIFTQLEEAIELTEKLRGEMDTLKITHRSEVYELKESCRKTVRELRKFEKERAEIWELKELYKSSKEQQEKTAKALKSAQIDDINQLTEILREQRTRQSTEVNELREKIREQAAEIERLKEENAALRGMVSKNSSNSSKPPSSDGFKKIANSREPTGRKPGGQQGHGVHKPAFYEKPTKIIEIKAKKCRCGGKVEYIEGAYKKKQLVDIEIKTNIIEYREYKGICGCCGRAVVNHSPVKDNITYGNKLKSLINMLSVEGNISINRLRQILSEVSGSLLKLSEGTICKWNKDLSKFLNPSIQKIKEKLLVSPVLHKDETGIHVGKKLNWFHVLSNDKYTLYYADKHRGKDADTEAGVLPAFKGILVHDNLKSLYHFDCTHAECNAHILRYLKGIIESKDRRWAKDMIEFLLYAKETSECAALSPSEILEFHNLYDEILERGRLEGLRDEKEAYYGDEMSLLRRLRDYKTEHLRFLSDKTVPFDNNQAERDLRMIKAKTKISGCFRSTDGDDVFAIIKSYTSSLRKNGLNIFASLVSAWGLMPVLF